MWGQAAPAPAKHNVIIFVADGLRRGSVTAEDMPTFYKLRTSGVDFKNSHAVFPTFTTANASAIATGHGLGDTGDYSNTLWPGVWLTKPDPQAADGTVMPFLENDPLLADMNATFNGNYLGEKPLLSVARDHGFNVAAIGKIGPTAIQMIDAVNWDDTGQLDAKGTILIDDSTGTPAGLPVPYDLQEAMRKAEVPVDAPLRSNGFGDTSQFSNGFSGDAQTPGTLAADRVQVSWLADVTTRVVLPKFAAEKKPFVLLFWCRDPDATQHNQGDSLQHLSPGINGPTSKQALHNADHALKELMDWLDANPAVKATTDVIVTSDHGFATITRREIAADAATSEPSANLTYAAAPKEKPEPQGTLPTGFLAVDLGIRLHMRVYDAAVRATTGASVYKEVLIGGAASEHPSTGSALLGDAVKQLDGTDAKIIVASNGGSDMLYVPSGDAAIVHHAVDALTQMDYIGGIFVDDKYCPSAKDCAGALPMSDVGLTGASKVPRPAIMVAFRNFQQTPGDLQSAAQIADTTLQEGQGNHGGFGRDQTWNNMAAIGPDFKAKYVDDAPMGNIDIAPTVAHILGIEMPSVGTLKGRVTTEALKGTSAAKGEAKTMVSEPASDGTRTVLEYETKDGVSYYDRACLVKGDTAHCP